jgi:RecA-family ATPase
MDNKITPEFDLESFNIGVEKNDILTDANNHLLNFPEEEITGEMLLREEAKPMECLLEPIIPKVGVATVAGSSDTGKSMFLRQFAIKTAAGEKEFLGFRINSTHQSCIFAATEDLRSATTSLLHKQAKGYRPEQLRNLRFMFDWENLIEELDKRLSKKPADLVIVDCFSDSFGGDLKDTQKIRTFLNPFQKLAETHQCMIVFLHHTGKRTENLEPSKNNLLSGQGLEAKMRLVFELRADPSRPDIRHLCIVKGNYLPSRYKKESFELRYDEDTFSFTNTGNRMPFELLSKNPNEDSSKAKYEQAKSLKEEGYTYEQIASVIGYESKGSVTKLFDRAKKNGWEPGVSNTVSCGNKGNNIGNA